MLRKLAKYMIIHVHTLNGVCNPGRANLLISEMLGTEGFKFFMIFHTKTRFACPYLENECRKKTGSYMCILHPHELYVYTNQGMWAID